MATLLSTLPPPAPGSRVRVHGIVSASGRQHNGRIGTVLASSGNNDDDKDRAHAASSGNNRVAAWVAVDLDPAAPAHGEQVILVRPRNLEMLEQQRIRALRSAADINDITGTTFYCDGCMERRPIELKKKCGGCKLMLYCSPACQKKHWRSGHKNKCVRVRATNKFAKKRQKTQVKMVRETMAENGGNFAQAYAALDASNDRDVEGFVAHDARAIMMLKQGKWEKAINHFRKGCKLDGERGLAALVDRSPVETITGGVLTQVIYSAEYLKTCYNPGNPNAQLFFLQDFSFRLEKIAHCLCELGRYAEAQKHVVVACELFPKRLRYALTHVHSLARNGDQQRASEVALATFEAIESGTIDLTSHVPSPFSGPIFVEDPEFAKAQGRRVCCCAVAIYKAHQSDLPAGLLWQERAWRADTTNAGSFHNVLEAWNTMDHGVEDCEIMVSRLRDVIARHKRTPLEFGDHYVVSFKQELARLEHAMQQHSNSARQPVTLIIATEQSKT